MDANKIRPVALVTGASAGIGEAIARELLGRGYVVYAVARRVERMEPLRSIGAEVLAMDVTDEDSMRRGVELVHAAAGRIDVLINNAGYGCYGALEDVPMAEARRQFEVNLFGLARLIQLVVPLMRSQKSGAIVNITSIAGRMHSPLGGWYHASKFAVEGLSDCLRLELAPFGIRVIVVEPGVIQTEWSDIARDGLLGFSGTTAYRAQAHGLLKMMSGAASSRIASPPEVVARTVARALLARRPMARYATGGGARMILAARRLLPDAAFDWLMTTSERLLSSDRGGS